MRAAQAQFDNTSRMLSNRLGRCRIATIPAQKHDLGQVPGEAAFLSGTKAMEVRHHVA
jgi:hypothetical protein